MKICILGNSHAASLKLGWDEISPYHPDKQLTFFASRQKGLKSLALVKNKLVPQTEVLKKNISFTSGGLNHVDLDEYDLFVTYGLGLPIPSFDKNYSSSVVKQTCLDLFSQSINGKICSIIRQASMKPIYVGHNPQKAALSARPEFRTNNLNYLQTLNLMNKAIFVTGAVIVQQPEETLINHWHTDLRFSVGSTRLDVGDKISGQSHPDHDFGHMNNDFGKLWLEALFRLI